MIEILYQDDRVIVCVKPQGVRSTDEPGGIPELLRRQLGGDGNIRGVHRLDQPVGGVMVFARTRRAAADLSRQIEDGAFRKQYLAVVFGGLSQPSGELRDWLHRDRRLRRTSVVSPDTPLSQEAVLRYETLAQQKELSLLRIELLTGRTHQIRCQLSSRGAPVLGDGKYGAPQPMEHIALWSYRIGFFHPRSGEWLNYMQKPPVIYPWSCFSNDFFVE